MLLSQIVLFAFTAHWLYSQYISEKNSLRKNMERDLSDSRLQLVDSMLLEHVINPVLKNEKGFKIHMAVSEEDSEHVKNEIETDKAGAFAFIQTTDSAIPPGLIKGKIERRIDIQKQSDTTKDLLFKGVKLIFDEVRSTLDQDEFVEETMITGGDTVLFQRIFSEKLDQSGINFPIRWVRKDSTRDVSGKRNTIFLESKLFPYSYGPEFSNFEPFLLRKIAPQISFAVVLLLLSAAAFYFSHRSLRDQTRLSALKNDFISNISHELKTPVSTVKVAIEALQNPANIRETDKVKEYLGIASIEITRLEQLIDKVLDTSTLEGRKDLIQPTKVNMNELIDEVLQSFQHRFRDNNVILDLENVQANVYALVDRLHVQGVLINLIDNSLKYSKASPLIQIRLAKNSNVLSLSISDNGLGIPEIYLDKVFEKFFRAPGQDIHNVKGSGLGLSYAALVMEQHKGTIKVENNPGGGCKFTLKFPVS
jgi:signal transduction histidine kinase